MKTARSLKNFVVLAWLGLLLAPLPAGQGVGVSLTDATVDTRGWFEPELVLSMHRVTPEVLENAVPGTGRDEELRVRGRDPGALARQPVIPNNDPNLAPASGLVADGVTPLLFRVSAAGGLTGEATYDVELRVSGWFADCPDLNGRLKVLKNGVFQPGRKITLSPANPDAYLVLGPVRADEIEDDADGKAKVVLVVRREDAAWYQWDSLKVGFGVRKPPVVLVHGYNSGPIGLYSDFAFELKSDRGHDFVFAVGYGNEDDNRGNTYDDLETLVLTLHHALEEQIESRSGAGKWADSGKWAWTRYDAVGHSQGGVLLRLLCSSGRSDAPATYAWRFSQLSNGHRGRFRRVVTVGSPHFGSTLAQLGIGIRKDGLKFGTWELAAANLVEPLPLTPDPDELLDKLLQPKFRVDIASSWPATPQELNNAFIPDPKSRLHMLGATIDDGQIPGPRPGLLATLPRIFKAVHLQDGDDENQIMDKRWGEWIAPHGSDGVVDLRSQMAARLPDSPGASASRMSSSDNVAHSPPKLAFDTERTETNDREVAQTVLGLLNGPASAFRPFPSAAECAPLHAEMNDTAVAIELILEQIRLNQQPAGGTCHTVLEAAPGPVPDGPGPGNGPENGPPALPETVNLLLQPPAGEVIDGEAVWSVVLYGPEGATTEGLTLTPSGTFGENLRIDIAAGVVGEVVASVQFPSTSGKTVIGEEGVVASRPPGTLTGIEIRPDSIGMLAGPTLPLEVWGTYDDGSDLLLFTGTANTAWLSDDPAVASVDAGGRVTLVAPGETTVRATYTGTHTATAVIDVFAPAPVITSAETVSGDAARPFAYQITAEGSPVAFSAQGLPEGLTVDPAAGLISGSPTYQGLFHFIVGATNDDGQQGSREVMLTVSGTNEAPMAIGLDNGSVPAQQAAGTRVGRFGTADANPLDTFTYELVTGPGDPDNGLFSIAGDELLTAAAIDPDSQPECAIRVRSTDSGGLFVEQALVLPVLGAPEITTPPADAIVFASRPFVLRAEATGREPLVFQWQEDGVDIPGANSPVLELTAGLPGSRSFSVWVGNDHGEQTSDPVTVTITPLSFGGWAAGHAVPGGDPVTPEGDLNGDGILNLFDYFFGTAPDETSAAMPFVRLTPGGPAYVYRRATHIEPVAADILSSIDLEHWNPYPPPPDGVRTAPLDEWTEEVEVDLPDGGKRFLKLEVKP